MKKTLLTLPENLLIEVQRLSGASTKSQAVIIAMEEYVRNKKLNRASYFTKTNTSTKSPNIFR